MAGGSVVRSASELRVWAAEDFARRKRGLTALSSSRWAGTVTRGGNDRWAPARRAHASHLAERDQAIVTVSARPAVRAADDGHARLSDAVRIALPVPVATGRGVVVGIRPEDLHRRPGDEGRVTADPDLTHVLDAETGDSLR